MSTRRPSKNVGNLIVKDIFYALVCVLTAKFNNKCTNTFYSCVVYIFPEMNQTNSSYRILGAVPASFNWLNDKADSHNQTDEQ